MYSFGKTLHITGWRVGYCVARPTLTRELRKVHQFNTFSIAAPLQEAIRLYLERHPDAWRGIAAFFSAKRDLLRERLAGSGLVMPPAQGSYFQLADYSTRRIWPSCNDVEFTERLINEAGRRRDPAVTVSTASRRRACASCGCAWPSATKRWKRRRAASAQYTAGASRRRTDA